MTNRINVIYRVEVSVLLFHQTSATIGALSLSLSLLHLCGSLDSVLSGVPYIQRIFHFLRAIPHNRNAVYGVYVQHSRMNRVSGTVNSNKSKRALYRQFNKTDETKHRYIFVAW